MNFNDAFEELNKLYESKADQELFINKFGKDRFDRFNKLKSKLANVKDSAGKNVSTDITYYVKNIDSKDLDALLDRAEGRQYVANTTTEYDIQGDVIPKPANTKKLMKSTANYDIYKVTDYTDSIDLARQKVRPDEDAYGYWCISGRFELANDEDVKVSQAEQYFNEYLGEQYKAYYFCMPKDYAINKYVICAYQGSNDVYVAFDSMDNEVDGDDAEVPEECLSFRGPDTGFTPAIFMSTDDFEADNGTLEYSEVSEYFENSPDDPCAEWFNKFNTDFDDFSTSFESVSSEVNTTCSMSISLSDKYFGYCPLIVELHWSLYDGYELAYISSSVMYPPDDLDEPLYELNTTYPTAQEFNAELERLYNVLQNMDLIKQAVDISKDYINDPVAIEPIIDTNELVQTMIVHDIDTKLGRLCATINLGFDPFSEMLKPASEATAWVSCYSNDDSSSDNISDTGSKEVKAADLVNLVRAQLDSSIKEIKDFVKNNK